MAEHTTDKDSNTTVDGEVPPGRPAWVAIALLVAGCAAILALKVLLIFRINVNWDEFYFLSHVHTLVRGELTGIFQLAYTHLFAWLPAIDGDEITQMLAARGAMIMLLIVTAVLIGKLACRSVSAPAAMVAPLCFLAASPILRHGGSFRADSLLAPLTLAVALLLTSRTPRRGTDIAAGMCLGAAFALSVKAVLFVPLAIALVLASGPPGTSGWWTQLRSAVGRVWWVGAVACCVAGAILLAHWLSLPLGSDRDTHGLAANAVRTTLLETPFFPRWDYFLATLEADRATWILIAAGAVVALAQRRTVLLASALSLLPLLFYRNAFPYYYVVMLAPASVLAAQVAETLRIAVDRRSNVSPANWIPVLLGVPLILQAALNLHQLRYDDVARQRMTIEVVHRIFPDPVAYIDHSGMISSFTKANFFMSTWGLEKYRERGSSFMREALKKYQPPLLLANRPVLEPGSPQFEWLLVEDRRLIEQFYLPYWGPIRVAGAGLRVPAGEKAMVAVPFPGRYRLETDHPVLIDGISHSSGAVLDIYSAHVNSIEITASDSVPVNARLVWAVPEPPSGSPPFHQIYTGF